MRNTDKFACDLGNDKRPWYKCTKYSNPHQKKKKKVQL